MSNISRMIWSHIEVGMHDWAVRITVTGVKKKSRMLASINYSGMGWLVL